MQIRWPHHLKQRNLIVQLPAVHRRRALKLGSTFHHHWPQICLLYHFITVRCGQLCLSLYYELAGCWCTCHFGCSHSYAWFGPKPLPSMKSGQCPCNTNQYLCANMWVFIGQDMHSTKKTMHLFGIPVSKLAFKIPAFMGNRKANACGMCSP